MSLYTEWKEGKIGSHQIMALISAFHTDQITGPEAVVIMDSFGLSATAKTQMQNLHGMLVAGTLTRSDLDNALMLGEVNAPGFSTQQEFLDKLGIG